ncbi:MAG: hypothetical protein HY904_20105 [Deltaproteobacteria bacterium]|nr:hypothetical protein [Deltaproteobacteria bacterium]
MRFPLVPGLSTLLLSTACYVTPSVDAGPACATTVCGCYARVQLAFTGQVMDNTDFRCLRGKLVRLRDRDGTVVAEATTGSAGTYHLNGEVERSLGCGGGDPVIRDDPEPGQSLPTYAYLPRRTVVDSSNEQVDLLRVPYGVTDAGTTAPALCLPPPADGGS